MRRHARTAVTADQAVMGADVITMWPISTRVNSPDKDDPSLHPDQRDANQGSQEPFSPCHDQLTTIRAAIRGRMKGAVPWPAELKLLSIIVVANVAKSHRLRFSLASTLGYSP